MKNISETEVLQILGKNNLNNYQVSGEKKRSNWKFNTQFLNLLITPSNLSV